MIHYFNKFCIEYSGIRENTFSFYVLNRQGEILFETHDSKSLKCSLNGGWDSKDSDGNDDTSSSKDADSKPIEYPHDSKLKD